MLIHNSSSLFGLNHKKTSVSGGETSVVGWEMGVGGGGVTECSRVCGGSAEY